MIEIVFADLLMFLGLEKRKTRVFTLRSSVLNVCPSWRSIYALGISECELLLMN